MQEQPLITIILPVYKVEPYINSCLDSVINQTYTNWECLAVDDGSPDKSGLICDEYAQIDSRIHIFHKPNGGVSSARNVGLNNANGHWVCFLDADDWWEPSFLQNFIDATEFNPDLILQGFIKENVEYNNQVVISLPNKRFNTASELIVYLEKASGVHNGYIWHRLYKNEIFQKYSIRFPEGVSFAEDGYVFFQYMQHATSSIMTSKVGYHYRIIDGSLTSQGKSTPKKTLEFLLKSYVSTLSEIMAREDPDEKIIVEIKKYEWRLAESWFINRGIGIWNSYKDSHEFLKSVISQNDLVEMKGSRLSLRILSFFCSRNTSFFVFLCIKCLSIYRKYESKILRHL